MWFLAWCDVVDRQRSEFGGEKGKEIEDRRKEVEKKKLKKIEDL